MTRKLFFPIIIMLAAAPAFGQGYGFVMDRDGFAFVRESPDAASPVKDTVYTLQVVETGEMRNGWVDVTGGNGESGWVHMSRLRPMPQEIHNQLGERFHSWGNVVMYVATPDLPHIIVLCASLYDSGPRYDFLLKEKYPQQEWEMESPVIVKPRAEWVGVVNLLNGKCIIDWGGYLPVQRILLYSGRLLIQAEDAQFSIALNKDGNTYLSVLLLRKPATRAYSKSKTDSAFKRAIEFKNRCKGKSTDEIADFAFDFNDPDDFSLLDCLHTAYYNGDSRAKELYPLVLRTMRSDGAGSQEISVYLHELWVHENAGTININEIGDDENSFWN